jgi:hypothetical protein
VYPLLPLSDTILLTSMPTIAQELHASYTAVTATMSLYLLAAGVGFALWGPVSGERHTLGSQAQLNAQPPPCRQRQQIISVLCSPCNAHKQLRTQASEQHVTFQASNSALVPAGQYGKDLLRILFACFLG